MKEVYSNDKYKVLNVSLQIGERMPLHEATSDAFIICQKGSGEITFKDRKVQLCQGETLLISAHDEHKMEILEDFCSNIILEADGKINFLREKVLQKMNIY